jgi:hypothetical protein
VVASVRHPQSEKRAQSEEKEQVSCGVDVDCNGDHFSVTRGPEGLRRTRESDDDGGPGLGYGGHREPPDWCGEGRIYKDRVLPNSSRAKRRDEGRRRDAAAYVARTYRPSHARWWRVNHHPFDVDTALDWEQDEDDLEHPARANRARSHICASV